MTIHDLLFLYERHLREILWHELEGSEPDHAITRLLHEIKMRIIKLTGEQPIED